MSLTRKDLRHKTLLRIDGLGGRRTATTIEADGIIDSTAFKRTDAGFGDFQGSIGYRPDVPEIDQIREMGQVDGSKLLQTGNPWDSQYFTEKDYELYYLLHPYIVNEAIRLASHEVYGEVHVPLTLWDDGDLSDTGIGSWSFGTITNPAKTSDTQYKFIGNHRSLLVPSAAGNFYVQSKSALVEPGDSIFHAAVGSLEPSSAGFCYYALWDTENNRAIYETTFNSYRTQIIRRQDTVPSNCHKIAIRAGATANGVTTVWRAFPSHMIGSGVSPVQSWLREQMNLLGFGPTNYYKSTGTDRFNASDRVWEQWTDENGHDFSLMPFVPASNYYSLQINRDGGLDARDYWIHGYRKMNEIQEELDDEAASTDIDEDMIMFAVEALVCDQLGPDYAEQARKAHNRLAFQRVARPVVQPKRETGIIRIGMRR